MLMTVVGSATHRASMVLSIRKDDLYGGAEPIRMKKLPRDAIPASCRCTRESIAAEYLVSARSRSRHHGQAARRRTSLRSHCRAGLAASYPQPVPAAARHSAELLDAAAPQIENAVVPERLDLRCH